MNLLVPVLLPTLVLANRLPQCDPTARDEALNLVGHSTGTSPTMNRVVDTVTEYLGLGCGTQGSTLFPLPTSHQDPFDGVWYCNPEDDRVPFGGAPTTFPEDAFHEYLTTCRSFQMKVVYPGPGVYLIPGIVELAAVHICLDRLPLIARLHQHGARTP